MRLSTAALAALIAFATFAGCRSVPASEPAAPPDVAEPVRITMWNLLTNDPREGAIRESIEKFNRTHRDVQIVPYFFENESYKNKLRVAMLSNNMPDVFYFWSGESFKRMVDSRVVADLTDMLDQYPSFRDSIVPEALESATYSNRVYGVPHSVQHVLVWYNKATFERYGLKPPDTWEELTAIVDELRRRGVAPVAAAGKERWQLLHWYAYLAHRLGGPAPFKRTVNGLGDFTDPSFVEAGERFRDFAARGAFMAGYLGMDQAQAEEAFVSGEAAMFLQGDWAAGRMFADERMGERLGYFRFPTVAGRGDPTEYQGGYSVGWAVSRTADLEAAFRVLTFMMSPEERARYVETSGTPTTVKGVRIAPERMSPNVYDYIRFIENDATGYFGFYDQDIDYRRAQLLLDASVSLAENRRLSRADIEAMLGAIE